MSRKRKTCLRPFENESPKKGRPTKRYTIKDAVRMVSVSLQKTVPKVCHFDGDVDVSLISLGDGNYYGLLTFYTAKYLAGNRQGTSIR
jgi:hypothetical protein